MKSSSFAFMTTCLHDSDSPVEVVEIDCTDFGSLGMAHRINAKVIIETQAHNGEHCVTLCDIRRQNITYMFFGIDCKWAINVYTQIM